tara:strand:- start:2585 stop:2749 length:165 start_codon:yes stop_codon:yes gene_type:complete
MAKYILIGLGITLFTFFTMHLWSKMSDKAKNKTIAAIFGLIAITFVVVLILLFL